MNLSYVPFVLGRVGKTFRETPWSHALTAGTMAMTLFLFGGCFLLQENFRGLAQGWGSRLQIFAYLEERIAPAEAEALAGRVRAYPEAASVHFVSQAEAWESFKKSLGSQSGLLEGLSAEILPPSFEIAVKPAYRDDASLARLAERLRKEKGVAQVEYPEEWIGKFTLLLHGIEWAKWIFGGALLLATLLIVGSTVELAIRARRDEIEILQLVGAPSLLIRTPFIVEGIVQGLTGAALALALLWLAFFFATPQISAALAQFTGRAELSFLSSEAAAFLALLGGAVGAAGSLVAVGRFLERW